MLYSDKNAKVLKELPRIDNVISMYVVGPNKYYSMVLEGMVEARSDFAKKCPFAKIKLHQIGIFFHQTTYFFH